MNTITITIVAGLMGMVGFGVADFMAKKAIDKIGNLRTLFYGQMFGAMIMAFYLIKDPSLPNINLGSIFSVILFGFFYTVGYLALYRAFEKGKISIVSPISSSSTILTAVVAFIFLGEKFSQLKIVTLILIIIGILLTAIDLRKVKDDLKAKDLSRGVPEAILVMLIFGVYVPLWAKFIAGPGWAVWVILVRAILVVLLFAYQHVIIKAKVTFRDSKIFYLLIFVSVFEALGSLGGSWGYNSAIGNTSLISALTSTYPLVTVMLAYVFLKERLATNQYLGISLIILGLIASAFV